MNDVKLRPCPFCGGTNITYDQFIRDGREVICRDCKASVHAFNPDANAKAIAAWNTRSDAALREHAERLALDLKAHTDCCIDCVLLLVKSRKHCAKCTQSETDLAAYRKDHPKEQGR